MIKVTSSSLYRKVVQVLSTAGISNARNEALWILDYAMGVTGLRIHTEPHQEVSFEAEQKVRQLVERRTLGEPIQYLLGSQEFRGLEFTTPRGVLIPRPETEMLVEEVLEFPMSWPNPVLVDVGTGSGCLAVALAVGMPKANVYAMDRSEWSVRIARENAVRHQVARRVKFLVGDLLAPLLSVRLQGKVAAIVANLPYISHSEWENLPTEVRDFEPRLALDGGADGLQLYRRLLPEAKHVLAPGGILVFEVGGDQAQRLLGEMAWQETYATRKIRCDDLGIERVVCLERKG